MFLGAHSFRCLHARLGDARGETFSASNWLDPWNEEDASRPRSGWPNEGERHDPRPPVRNHRRCVPDLRPSRYSVVVPTRPVERDGKRAPRVPGPPLAASLSRHLPRTISPSLVGCRQVLPRRAALDGAQAARLRASRWVSTVTLPISRVLDEASQERSVPAAVHFVDVGQIGTELRPVCGSWSDDVTWTTIHSIVTCPLCARLVRGERSARSHRSASPSSSSRGARGG